MSDFAARIVALRHERDLTQTQLAQLVTLDVGAISRIERGLAPSISQVVKLARGLTADRDELLGLAALEVETRGPQ